MGIITGRDAVGAIERLLDKQAQDAQETKQLSAIRLVSAFATENQIPPQTGAVATISRIVRKLDDEGVRQVRSLSESLLNRDEETLRAELEALRDALMPIEARVHQVKTRTAFIATALRPFSVKYTDKWFAERTDLNRDFLKAQVLKLESEVLTSTEGLVAWAKDVSDLFEQLVIYRGSDAGDYYTRPAGTINERSSRTYLQAWLSFIGKFKDDIWLLLSGGQLKSEYDFKLSRSNDFQYEPDSAKEISLSLNSLEAPRETLKFSKAASKPSVDKVQAPKLLTKSKHNLDWVEVFIESKVDASVQATRRWENMNDFELSLQKWLDTLPVIWGELADEITAKVSVKTDRGESEITLPALKISAAADRLTKAAAMQLD